MTVLFIVPFKYLSLFSGIGGFEVGLEKAGFECVGAVEIDKAAAGVFAHHYPGVPLWRDVRQFSPEKDLQVPIDVIVAGFPCQDHSSAGKRRGLKGNRGSLFYAMLDIIKAVHPQAFLLENVPGLLSVSGGEDMFTVLEELEGAGYTLDIDILDSQFLGVPQRRRRLFFVGLRNDHPGLNELQLRRDAVPRDKQLRKVLEVWKDHLSGALSVDHVKVTSRLSDILERQVDRKYFLSPKACAGILRRAKKRGKSLPPHLDLVLREVAGELILDIAEILQSARYFLESTEVCGTLSSRSTAGGGLGTDLDLAGGLQVAVGTLMAGGKTAGSATTQDAETGMLVAYGGNRTGGSRDTAACLSTSQRRISFENDTFVTHTLTAEGFDASEDGPGRGPPLVPALYASPSDDILDLLQLGARRAWSDEWVPVAYRVHGENSCAMRGKGVSRVADPVDVARCLDTQGGYAPNQGGNIVLQPIPLLEPGARTGRSTEDVACGSGIGDPGDPTFTLQASKQHGVAFSMTGISQWSPDTSTVHTLRARITDDRLVVTPDVTKGVVAFDTTQITSKRNGNNPQWGDPCHPLASTAHPPAIAFTQKDSGGDVGEEVSPTLRAMGHSGSHANAGGQVAVAYRTNSKGQVDCQGEKTGALVTSTDPCSHFVAFQSSQSGVRTDDVHATLDANMGSRRHNGVFAFQTRIARNGRGDMGDKVSALTSQAGSHGDSAPCVAGNMGVRRLTPTECERLQSYPKDWTRWRMELVQDGNRWVPSVRVKDPVEQADGPRYRQCGNGVTSCVIEKLGRVLADLL